MYCPRCDRTIKKDDLDQLNQELKKKFDVDSLERGNCPVCGTALIDRSKVPAKKELR
ncbi:hypothetical protein [Methanomassiliicoccus luminyensis]|jgi:hypothetical protein|uniref:hypothetical protein n=1 Tax=Methanomassiliicoccus luminyensis TaxID=1080712 RepID=UPI0003756845|nr:hypothetical protein [Methanomassiliicoccus luminyensis]